MYHSKKIGVFVSHIMGSYQKNVCQGIIDEAFNYGYTTEIFVSMDGENLGASDSSEETVLLAPNYENFSGVVYASDTYVSFDLKDTILAALKERCSCPVVQLAVTDYYYPALSIENNVNTEEIVRHLVTKHNCKRICFLGCNTESFFSDNRHYYYEDTMKSFSMPIGENDVYSCTYDEGQIAQALDFFCASDKKIDAIVCYNDRLALLLMTEAQKRGFKIPEDFAVTGCDNLEAGQNVTPTLTTVSFPAYELGTSAVDSLVKLIQGNEIPMSQTVQAKVLYGGSCGCEHTVKPNNVNYYHDLSSKIDDIEGSIMNSIRMANAFQRILDVDEGMDLLEQYVKSIEHCKEFYLCLYSNWDSLSQDILQLTNSGEEAFDNDSMYLKLGIKDGKRLPECSYKKTSLLPEQISDCSDSCYICTPLFFENKPFGFIALSYENNQIDYHFQLIHWFMNISQMLERMRDTKRTSILVERLEDVYIKDSLTGLYNKHGYLHKLTGFLDYVNTHQTTVTCFIFDLDRLKYINDTYGHSEGDFAIQVIGHALISALKSTDICARFSGDEFYLLGHEYTAETAQLLLERIEKYISNYNKLSNKEYTISVSGGFAQLTDVNPLDSEQIDELFTVADQNMYEQKKKKKEQ